jgi:WD40 repeat protein
MLLYNDHTAVIYALAFAPDGSTLASGARDGTLLVHDAAGQPHTLGHPKPFQAPIHALGYSPDGSTLVIGGGFGWLEHRAEGPGGGKLVGPRQTDPVTALAILGERTVVVGSGDRVQRNRGKLELWDLDTGQRRTPYFEEPNGVRAVAVCSEKRLVAWATGQRKVCVWEILKRSPVELIQPKDCQAVAVSPDGQQLAVAVDYGVRLFDLEQRRVRLELKGHKGQVAAVAFSPDGTTLATGSWDQTVKLWDVATGQERITYRWPIGRVYCVSYAPDGLRLAAGGDLGRIVVWDLE